MNFLVDHSTLHNFCFHFLQFKSTHVIAIPAKMAPLAVMMLTTFPNTSASAETGSVE